jgi:hypothetical protein
VIQLSDLSHEEFLRWARDTGFAELAALMLWRWDPRDCADAFPESANFYWDKAQTTLYGLQAGDDQARFIQRLRANAGIDAGPAYATETLARLHARVERWLAISLPLWRHESELAALRSLPFHCHIHKYDPARQIGAGYDDGSWTSISDIGERFNGEVLTREQYEAVETAHVDTVLAMCRESGITTLEPIASCDERCEGSIGVEAFAGRLRRILREEDGSSLWRDPQLRFYVAVGFDYHLYAGSHVTCPEAVELGRRRGLHPEVGAPSPWLDAD